MSEEKTYLELSENEGTSHKFYEVIINGTEVNIRYGRIGDKGQSQSTTYPTPEKAKTEAQKKINEKLKKGYEPAIMGVRQKRSITRREVTSSNSTAKKSPILWKFNSGSSAFGIFIDEQYCWVGNQQGLVYKLNHQGEVLNQFKLPEGVKCIVADDVWVYAGCDDGNVYDLSGKIPRFAYEIEENIDIFWLDIHDGILAVSDAKGAVVKIDPESESQWTRLSQGQGGWMVRIDQDAIYHGHGAGVTAYELSEGRQIWHQKTGGVLFGWQEKTIVYAGCADKKIYSVDKTGEAKTVYKCDATVYSCATAEGGKYVFAGDNSSSIYCFDNQGDRLWKLATGCGSALSMQCHQNRVYIVTTDGSFACIDAQENAIDSAQLGEIPVSKNIKAPAIAPVLVSNQLESTNDGSQGVIVECFKQGNKLRIRVISPCYNSDWMVQFPRDIRIEGARYLVEEIREATSGGFYRVYGEIKRLME
jgi:outer membrane protein assembly factor BamB